MLYDFSRISGLNPDKLTRNAICSVHSIAACALSFSYIKLNLPHNIAYNFSTTYFIWDSIITIINKENKVFILHHIIAIYTLSFEMEFIYFLLFISELSNFWNYIVYYYLHIDSSPRVDVAMGSAGSAADVLGPLLHGVSVGDGERRGYHGGWE